MNETIVVLETNQGNIELRLNKVIAPLACENFTKLIQNNYYNGLVFHRVIKNFMIQCGDTTGTGKEKEVSIWGKYFVDEVNFQVKFDYPGILAMANAGPNTNGSQFFITCVRTPHLNMKHTIFGEVSLGLDVVKKIENAPIGDNNRPVTPQIINLAYVKGQN